MKNPKLIRERMQTVNIIRIATFFGISETGNRYFCSRPKTVVDERRPYGEKMEKNTIAPMATENANEPKTFENVRAFTMLIDQTRIQQTRPQKMVRYLMLDFLITLHSAACDLAPIKRTH